MTLTHVILLDLFARVCSILKYLSLHKFLDSAFHVPSHSQNFHSILTNSILSYLSASFLIFIHGPWLCRLICDDFAKMMFLVYALILQPFICYVYQFFQSLLHHPWAICFQVLPKYQYPENVFQALTTKDVLYHFVALQLCANICNFFQIIWPT